MTGFSASNMCQHAALLPLYYFLFILPLVNSQPEPTPLTEPCPVVLPTTSRIVGGTLIEAPYMVSFLTTVGACSGTLITPTDILTAKHCEINTLTRAYLSSTNGTDGTLIPIRSVVNHPRDDIMLVTLARPANVDPVKILANPQLPSDWSFVRAQGYGIQSAFPFPSDARLRFVDFPVIPTDLCEEISKDVQIIDDGGRQISISLDPAFPDDYLCTGYLQSASCTFCSGDSGGAVFTLLRGEPVLLGVISRGTVVCTLPGTAGFSARVSSYIEWLDEEGIQYDAVTELSETFVNSDGVNGGTGGTGGGNNSRPRIPSLNVEVVQVGLSAGAIAGIAVGGVAALLIVILAAVFIIRKKTRNGDSDLPADNVESGGPSATPASTGGSLLPPNQPEAMPNPSNLPASPPEQAQPMPLEPTSVLYPTPTRQLLGLPTTSLTDTTPTTQA